MQSRHEQEWDHLASIDPLWAILSDPAKRGGGWETEEFLATGERDVAHLVGVAERSGRPLELGRALDFGCGVGRLTRALAIAEDAALGIDPVARARIVLNAQLAIARARGEASEDDAARSSLACALEVDPEGPIREIVAAELASLDTLARR